MDPEVNRFMSSLSQNDKMSLNNFRIQKIVYVNPQKAENTAQTKNIQVAMGQLVKTQQAEMSSIKNEDKKFIRLVPTNKVGINGANNTKTVTLTNIPKKPEKSEVILLPSPRAQQPLLPKTEKISLIEGFNSIANNTAPTVIKINSPKNTPIQAKTILKSCLPIQRPAAGDFSQAWYYSNVQGSPKVTTSGLHQARNSSPSVIPKFYSSKKQGLKKLKKAADGYIPTPIQLQNDLVRTLNFASFQPFRDEDCDEDSSACSDEEMNFLYDRKDFGNDRNPLPTPRNVLENNRNVVQSSTRNVFENNSVVLERNGNEQNGPTNGRSFGDDILTTSGLLDIIRNPRNALGNNRNVLENDEDARNSPKTKTSNDPTILQNKSVRHENTCDSNNMEKQSSGNATDNDSSRIGSNDEKQMKSKKAQIHGLPENDEITKDSSPKNDDSVKQEPEENQLKVREKRKYTRRKNKNTKELQTDEEQEDAMLAEAWDLLKKCLVEYVHLPNEFMKQYQIELCEEFDYNDDAITMVTDKSLYVWQLIERLG